MVQAGRSIGPEVVMDDALAEGRLVAFRPAHETWYRPLFGYATCSPATATAGSAGCLGRPRGSVSMGRGSRPRPRGKPALALGAARRAPGLRLVESWSRRLGVSGSTQRDGIHDGPSGGGSPNRVRGSRRGRFRSSRPMAWHK
jgi:hypothetical protein